MYTHSYQPYKSTIKSGAIRGLGKIQLKPVSSLIQHPDIEKLQPKGMVRNSIERSKN